MPNPIAFVLLEQPIEPDFRQILLAFKKRHPGISLEMKLGPDGAPMRVPLLQIDGVTIAVMAVETAMPDGWQVLAQRAAAYWSDATAALGRHKAHLIVSAVGAYGDRLKVARCITALLGAIVVAVPNCLGVLWDSVVAHPARNYEKFGLDAFAPFPDMPVSLWVSFHPFQEPGITGAVTMGLQRFVDREIEFVAPGKDAVTVLNRMQGLVVYLLQNGAVLGDGDTIGVSVTEHIKVRHLTSQRFSGLPVYAARMGAS